jgi:hypothetical protein
VADVEGVVEPVVAEPDPLSGAYAFLQKVIGLIAVTLPLVIVLGDVVIDRIDDEPLNSSIPLGSISVYYYERTGGYFVGSLFALAVFFLSYDIRPRAGRTADNLLSSFASAMAVGVALLPTSSAGSSAQGGAKVVGTIHLVCAATLFGLLAIFSLYQFTKTAGEVTSQTPWRERLMRIFRTAPGHAAKMTSNKRQRNTVYRVCGWIIVVCIAMVGVSNLADLDLLFWCESVAVIAFGVSWLVKGGFLGILAD